MEPLREPRNLLEPKRCRAADIIVYPSANRKGCATSPIEFAQIAGQRISTNSRDARK
jgi:hypothetical protein